MSDEIAAEDPIEAQDLDQSQRNQLLDAVVLGHHLRAPLTDYPLVLAHASVLEAGG